MRASTAGPSTWARRLGFGGLVPFVGLAAAPWMAWPVGWPPPGMALLGYGMAICSFLGAIHWGLVMRDGPAQPVPPLLWGVVPSLLAWLALLLGQPLGLLMIAVLLWVCFAVDRILYPRYHAQAWLPMRLRLTLVASTSCLVAAAALLQ